MKDNNWFTVRQGDNCALMLREGAAAYSNLETLDHIFTPSLKMRKRDNPMAKCRPKPLIWEEPHGHFRAAVRFSESWTL